MKTNVTRTISFFGPYCGECAKDKDCLRALVSAGFRAVYSECELIKMDRDSGFEENAAEFLENNLTRYIRQNDLGWNRFFGKDLANSNAWEAVLACGKAGDAWNNGDSWYYFQLPYTYYTENPTGGRGTFKHFFILFFHEGNTVIVSTCLLPWLTNESNRHIDVTLTLSIETRLTISTKTNSQPEQ